MAQQQVAQLPGPGLVLLLRQKGQVAHHTRPTPAVPTGPVVVLAGPAVMGGASAEARPDPNRFGRRFSPPGMPRHMGQPARAVDVQPVQPAMHAHTRLIGMPMVPGRHQVGNTGDRGRQRLGGLLPPAGESPRAASGAEQVRERLPVRSSGTS